MAEPPAITDNDLANGMMNLINRGMIPKDVDLTPAFSRGIPSFYYKAATMFEKMQLGLKTDTCSSQALLTGQKIQFVASPSPVF